MSMIEQGETRFSVGDALSLTFRELTRRFAHYLLLITLLSLPGLAVSLAMPIDPSFGAGPNPPTPEEFAAVLPAFVAAMIVSLLVYAVMIGAFTYSVVSGLRGTDLSLGECVSSAIGCIHYVLATILLVGVVVAIGFFLLIVPGIIAILILFVAGSVAAAESAWPGEAFSRSSFLTKGARWSILGLIFVQLLIGLILLLVLSIVAVSFLGVDAKTLAPDQDTLASYTIVSVIIGLPFNAFFAILPVTVYYLLSVEKDGRDAGQVAQAFE